MRAGVLHGTHLPPNKVLLRRQRHAAKVRCELLDAWRHAFTRRGADKGDDHSYALPEHPPMYRNTPGSTLRNSI